MKFYERGIITHVCTKRHRVHKSEKWYEDAYTYKQREDLVDEVDILFIIEKPFDWGIIEYAASKGKPTVIMPMYECTPDPMPILPTALLYPSLLDQEYYEDYPIPGKYIPIPVDVPWRERDKALKFVHNAGHIGMKKRNGTGQLLDAMKLVKSGVELILRSQVELPGWSIPDNVDLRIGTFPYESLWEEGDAFVFPDKFAGLSLPIQEAYASGMLVVTTDKFPYNTILPTAPLIPSESTEWFSLQPHNNYRTIESHILSPQKIADTLDLWNRVQIDNYSLRGKEYADKNSWEVLKPIYLDFFESLL